MWVSGSRVSSAQGPAGLILSRWPLAVDGPSGFLQGCLLKGYVRISIRGIMGV